MAVRLKHFAVVSLLLFLSHINSAVAGPPFVTDDPEPVDHKHGELYLFSTYTHTAGVDSAQLAAIEANYGIIPDIQLHLIASLAYDRVPDDRAEVGYGDTELGVKYRFIHETDTLPQVATFPLLELPTGDSGRGLGAGRVEIFAPLWFQKSFGADKKWTAYGGGGFWYTPGLDHRNFLRFGAVLQRELSEHLTLGGEIYHETPSAKSQRSTPTLLGPQLSSPQIGVQGHTAFNLGGQYNFDEHYHLLFSAGRDLDGPNRFSTYLAVQFTF